MISLDMVKEWVDIQDTVDDDQLLRNLIRRTVAMFEMMLGEKLDGRIDFVEVMTPIGRDFVRVSSLIRSLDGLDLMSADGTWDPQDLAYFADTGYAVYPLPHSPTLFDTNLFNSVRISYNTGYDIGEVPPEMEGALLQAIEHAYRTRLTVVPPADLSDISTDLPGPVKEFLSSRKRLAGV